MRAGITHILFAVRPEKEAAAIDAYLKSLRPVPSPYLVDGKLSAAAQRGKKLFFNDEVGCAKCHPAEPERGPLYTDMLIRDVASRGEGACPYCGTVYRLKAGEKVHTGH